MKLANDEHVKRLKLDNEMIIEKYNKGVLYGINTDGTKYYNHFKRDNEGFWSFRWYEEQDKISSYEETVKEHICKILLENAVLNLEKLISLEAPQIIIDKRREFIIKLQNGNIDIHGDTDCLKNNFETIKSMKGRGGKIYYIINDEIYFFPNAKYGMYIKHK